MSNEAPITAGGAVILRERFEIDPAKPINDLSMPQALAFACVDKRGAGRSLFALICRHDLPIRVGSMRAMKGVQAAGVLTLVEYGIVDWPLVGRKVMAVVYERPGGPRVLPKPGGKFEPVPEILFPKKVLRPLFNALNEMSQRGVIHRAIRLDNLYWSDPGKDHVVLGDYTTSPPGYDNPALYEPLELAMANPEGRGQTSVKDDLYALGMVSIGLLNGRDFPVQGQSAPEVVASKLAQSTYANYATESRVPLNLLELLRGLLCDDTRDRWKLEDLDLWLNGRRVTPIQPKPAKRSQRPFRFEGKDYFSVRELANAMSRLWDAAIPVVMDGRVEIWLRRGLEDNELADVVASVIRVAQATGDQRQVGDLALARVLLVLDPRAPIRYREVRVTLDGFGNALATASMQKKPLRPYAEILARDLAKHWVSAQGYHNTELAHYESQFKDLAGNLSTPMMGWGIERCLYELNETLHCQSPLIEAEFVSDIRELLPALDRAAQKLDPKTKPVDRHIAAYIGVKWQRDTKVQFRTMAEQDPIRATLGMVSLLAVLQWRLGPPALHGLCGWVGGQLGPLINSYNNREKRKELEKEIPRLVRKGSLPDLYNLLDNHEERLKDAEGFAWARAEYAAAEQQLKAAEQGRTVIDERAALQGQQAAAVMATCIALLTVTVMLFMKVW